MPAKLVCLFGLIFSHFQHQQPGPCSPETGFFSGTPFLSKLNPHIVNTLDGS